MVLEVIKTLQSFKQSTKLISFFVPAVIYVIYGSATTCRLHPLIHTDGWHGQSKGNYYTFHLWKLHKQMERHCLLQESCAANSAEQSPFQKL